MPLGDVEVLALAGQRAGLRGDRRAHEHRVAELVVVRHGLEHRAALVEAQVRDSAHERRVARVAGPARELGEHDVAGHRQRIRTREAVLRPVDVRLDERAHRVDLAELQPAKQRDRIDVGGVGEVVPVLLGQLREQVARTAREPTLDLAMRVGFADVGHRAARPSESVADHGRLGTRPTPAGAFAASAAPKPGVATGDQHEIGPVRADEAPHEVRFGVLAIRMAGRRKLEPYTGGIRERDRDRVICRLRGFCASSSATARCTLATPASAPLQTADQ